jgi:hypothetical protein
MYAAGSQKGNGDNSFLRAIDSLMVRLIPQERLGWLRACFMSRAWAAGAQSYFGGMKKCLFQALG